MILVLNAGSSSIKYTLFNRENLSVLSKGLVEKIGEEEGRYVHRWISDGSFESSEDVLPVPDHLSAFELMVKNLTSHVLEDISEIEAVGHRVVHGGERFSDTVEITEEVKDAIKALSSLAPLHNPANLTGIEVSEKVFPDAMQIGVFDTAFHQTIPNYAYRYAIPNDLYTKGGIRKYGFHGTSHRYITETCQSYFGKKDVNLIIAHLGNGCSMTAVEGGKSVANSMGLTPLPGLIMGTRSGDIDPAVVFHLVKYADFSLESVEEMLNKQSGLLGICGHLDLRDIVQMEAEGDKEASLALAMYCYRIKQYIGQYLVTTDTLDALVFTAGVGENSAQVRERVMDGLGRFGLILDPARNESVGSSDINVISGEESPISILVIPTDEEKQIAREAQKLLA